VFSWIIHFLRFIKGSNSLDCFVYNLKTVWKIIPQNSGNSDRNVNPGPAQVFKGNHREPFQVSIAEPDWFNPKQAHKLGHALSISPHYIVCHPVKSHILRITAFVLDVLIYQNL